MPRRTNQQVIELLRTTGHLEYPFGEAQAVPRNAQLKITSPEVVKALASYQDFMAEPLDALSLYHNGRAASHDGHIGPATRAILNCLRCEHPDYGPKARIGAALGTGGWKNCHGASGFHHATFHFDESGMGSHLRPVFEQALQQSIASYAELGLKFTRVQQRNGANIQSTFVQNSSGWIGLALIGPGSCNGSLWSQFLASYRGRDVLTEWTTLIKHEWGHNVGLQHSRGGVMNPSILTGLPISWKNDPSWPILARMYGGQPVPGAGPEDRYWIKLGYQDNFGGEKWITLPVPIKVEGASLPYLN